MRHIREAILGAFLLGVILGAGALYTSNKAVELLGEETPTTAVVEKEDKLYQMVLYRNGPNGVMEKRAHEEMTEYECAFRLSVHLMVNAKQYIALGVAGKCEPAIDVADMLSNSNPEAWQRQLLDT